MLVGLFEKILSMSMFSCYVILVVMLIRLLLRKCERKYSFLLWFVVFLNLCLPISIEGPFSLVPMAWIEWTQELTEEREVPVQEEASANTGEIQQEGLPETKQPEVSDIYYVELSGNEVALSEAQKEAMGQEPVGDLKLEDALEQQVMNGADQSEAFLSQPEEQVSMEDTEHVPLSWQVIACYLWLVVIGVLWGLNILKSVMLGRRLKNNRTESSTLQEGVIFVKGLEAPFLWGVWNPMIYLPENIGEEEKSYIIAHESYHRKRFDHITKLVVFVIVTIHWFNPFVWVAYALFVRDMEISCDEAVLVHAQKDIKKQYASSLLKYAAKQNGFVFSPLTFGEPSLKARIRNVLRYKKRGVVLTVVAIIIVCLTACGLITRPLTEEEPPQLVNTPTEPETTKEPDTQPEATKEPEDTPLLPEYRHYPSYFYEILCSREVEGMGQLQRDEGMQHSYSLPESVTEYKEAEPAYSANRTILLEDGANVQIDWMKLENDLILEKLSFDMKDAFTQEGVSNGMLVDIFYDRDWNKVFLLINAFNMTVTTEDYKEVTWLVEFAPETPQDYSVERYDTSGAWFGECRRIGDSIFLHGGAGTEPYEINLLTKEGRTCWKEYCVVRGASQDFSREYQSTNGPKTDVHWFSASGQYDDVTIFTGAIQEDMDMPTLATIYLAQRDGEMIEAMLINEETGEITRIDDFSNVVTVKQVENSQIGWFQEALKETQLLLNCGNARLMELDLEAVAVLDKNITEVTKGYWNSDGSLSLLCKVASVEEPAQEYILLINRAGEGCQLYSREAMEKGASSIISYQSQMFQYPEWAQVIIDIRNNSNKNARDFGWENSVLPVFSEMTGDEEAVYGDSGDVTPNSDYVLECWMKLKDGTLLENLHFDLKQVMQDKLFTRAFVTGVFYREDLEQVYIALPVLDVGGGVMIVSFSPDAPEDYEVHAYRGMSVWFGECVMVGDDICLHAANDSCPWRINIETWEVYYTEKEFEHTQELTESFLKEYEAEQGIQLSLQWFYASGRVGDVEVYTGYLGEDVSSTAATIYTAYEDGAWIGAMIVDERAKEVRFLSSLPQAVSPITLKTSSTEAYNTIAEINGYQYYFQLDMNTVQMQLEIGESMEEERYYGKVQVKPVFVTDGDRTEQLGVLRGYILDVTSSLLIEPSHAEGERLCGKVRITEEGKLAFYQAEAVDRDTYMEYINISEEADLYLLAENAELVMLDSNFRNTSVTYDRFLEHLSRSEDTIYYITVQDGKVVQVWEPYNP